MLPWILCQSHDCVHFHGSLEPVFKRPALCRSSHDNILLLGLGLISVCMKSARATCADHDHIILLPQSQCYALGSEGKLPSAQGLSRTAEEIRAVPVPPMRLQPVPKHRSCDFPQAVLKSQLVISSCRANCRWFLLKIIQHITERAGMWTLLQSSCWKSTALLSLYLLHTVATLKLSSESCGI